MEIVLVFAAGAATALATGLGAIPVALAGVRGAGLMPFLSGVAIGVMAVAAIAGLLLPALEEGSGGEVLAGSVGGLGFVA